MATLEPMMMPMSTLSGRMSKGAQLGRFALD
jgi:hypothetical protein